MKLTRYYIAFKAILTKEVLRFMRIWIQTVLPPAITTALYFIIFGKLIGEQIGEMDGYRYIDFIVPGLILMSVISNSYANVVSSFYSSKFQRHIEELLISPVPNAVILAGYVGGGVARGIVVGITVTMVSMFFSDWQIHSYPITLLVFVLTSILFAMAGFINAIYANSFDDISIVFYMINAFRYGLLGSSDIPLGIAFSIIIGFILVLGAFSLWLLKKGVGIKN